MPDDPTFFHSAIDPFKDLWHKLRIAGVAILRNDRWISMSTRLALSHSCPEPDFFIQPTPDFVAFSSDIPLSVLNRFLDDIRTKGCFSVRVQDQTFEIFLTFAHAKLDSTPHQIVLGPPFSTLGHEHEGSFELGASQFRLSNLNVESHPRLISYDQLHAVSSQLRMHIPTFEGVADLLAFLGVPFDKHQNQTSFEIVAPLPFAMTCSDSAVSVTGPTRAMEHLRIIGFFDTGQAAAKTGASDEVTADGLSVLSAEIPWPVKARSGKLFLYFLNHEVGSVSVRRWVGTASWRIQVQEFFDSGRTILKEGLQARKEQTEFETAVVRLLNELRTPTVWFGDRQYQDRPDLAACIELKNQWIVLLGECTVQKPSVKFTPLLTRKTELERMLRGELRVLPVVFTSSTTSSSDKGQARQDGIALVGATELAALLQGVDQEWGPEQLIRYLDGLFIEPFDFPERWQS